jgi:putative flavoprotein involved in K+ transport
MPDTKPTRAIKSWLKKLETALTGKDTDKAVKLFGKDSYWRDLVSLTWNIKTVEGRDAIADMLKKTLASAKPHSFQDRRRSQRGWRRSPKDGSPSKRQPGAARVWCA